ncbi:MAG: hypothetical protein KKE11_03520 [Gammaproteobacteria bacterium]|nr:hypothetical protein [Gammaproteobacteria bacterium]
MNRGSIRVINQNEISFQDKAAEVLVKFLQFHDEHPRISSFVAGAVGAIFIVASVRRMFGENKISTVDVGMQKYQYPFAYAFPEYCLKESPYRGRSSSI